MYVLVHALCIYNQLANKHCIHVTGSLRVTFTVNERALWGLAVLSAQQRSAVREGGVASEHCQPCGGWRSVWVCRTWNERSTWDIILSVEIKLRLLYRLERTWLAGASITRSEIFYVLHNYITHTETCLNSYRMCVCIHSPVHVRVHVYG